MLTRFKKSLIEVINIQDIKNKIDKFDEFSVIVSSMRLDNFVSEITKTSRTKAIEIIEDGRVFVNYEDSYKSSRLIKEGDILIVRGKGKFIIENIERYTRREKLVVNIKKYI